MLYSMSGQLIKDHFTMNKRMKNIICFLSMQLMLVFTFGLVSKEERLVNGILSRGEMMSNAAAAITPFALQTFYPLASFANEELRQVQSHNVLLDLPPRQPNTIRLYLCRHGQTENNRLHIVQGARIDPPLNDTGRRMAHRLGQQFAALRALDDNEIPNLIFHSKLQRSRETASIAQHVINNNDGIQSNPDERIRLTPRLNLLDSLGEVDFGFNCEGRPETTSVRTGMHRTYAAWALGNLDATNFCSSTRTTNTQDQGETGRSVLQRAAATLTTVLEYAKTENTNAIIAVSHSVFLRTLLALAMDIPLFEASVLQQTNGCINVLDLDPKKKFKRIGNKSNLYLGTGPRDFAIEIPHVNVIRVNEKRHLAGLV